MNDALAKEKILYDSVSNKTRDKDFCIAFCKYMEFIMAEFLVFITNHFPASFIERKSEIEEIGSLHKKIMDDVSLFATDIERIVKEYKLQENVSLLEDISQVNRFLKNEIVVLGEEPLDSLYDYCEDVLRRLISLGLEKEVAKHATLKDSRVKEIIALKKIKELHLKRIAFNKKDARTPAGSFFRLTSLYLTIKKQEDPSASLPEIDPNNSVEVRESDTWSKEYEYLMSERIHSGTYFSKEKHMIDVEILHNEILLNHPKVDDSRNCIFHVQDGKIFHYQNGIMNYELKGVQEPKFIKMFKNIITYMPNDKRKIRIGELEKRINKLDKCGTEYRSNIGKNAKSFNNFLKQNGIQNVHPKTKSPIISATDEYVIFDNKI